MQFRTEININEFRVKISHHDKMMFIGSCFSENMNRKMSELKFQTSANPCGISYNPLSICESIGYLIDGKEFNKNNLFLHNDLYHSIKHHSSFSSISAEDTLNRINGAIAAASAHLKQSEYLFLTLGTAWIYRLTENGSLAANCHKLPGNKLTRSLLTVNEIFSELLNTINRLKIFNPKINIVFTVSPVRHWKDGAIDNQRSKSILFTAVHEVIEKTDCASYFPSYEIMMDELRDYRFYADDMLHPAETAINYIFEKFSAAFFSKETIELNNEIIHICRMLNHKSFFPGSEEHKKFIQLLKCKIENMHEKAKYINFKKELSELN